MDCVSEYSITIVRSSPIALTFTDLSTNGTPIDMSTATLRFVAKYGYDDVDANAVIVRTTGGGGITTTTNTVTVSLVKSNTSSLPYCHVILFYELVWQNGSGEYQVVAKGKLYVKPNVNRT